jgi:hypothetical protein
MLVCSLRENRKNVENNSKIDVLDGLFPFGKRKRYIFAAVLIIKTCGRESGYK